MSHDQVRYRLGFILYGEDAWRGSVRRSASGAPYIIFDAHGLTVKEARKLIEDIARIYLVPISLEIIHGFHHSTGIKDMLTEETFNDRLISRAVPDHNPGVTIFQIAAAA